MKAMAASGIVVLIMVTMILYFAGSKLTGIATITPASMYDLGDAVATQRYFNREILACERIDTYLAVSSVYHQTSTYFYCTEPVQSTCSGYADTIDECRQRCCNGHVTTKCAKQMESCSILKAPCPGLECVNGLARYPSSLCTSNSDCTANHMCHDRTCVAPAFACDVLGPTQFVCTDLKSSVSYYYYCGNIQDWHGKTTQYAMDRRDVFSYYCGNQPVTTNSPGGGGGGATGCKGQLDNCYSTSQCCAGLSCINNLCYMTGAGGGGVTGCTKDADCLVQDGIQRVCVNNLCVFPEKCLTGSSLEMFTCSLESFWYKYSGYFRAFVMNFAVLAGIAIVMFFVARVVPFLRPLSFIFRSIFMLIIIIITISIILAAFNINMMGW